ncbi:MAG: hypothetical protein EOM88_01360 [Clostridia bacterium]|nr:hypothetical protein [Clostridia bacterium]
MLKSNFFTLFLQIIIRFFNGIIFFPFWWYSKGFIHFVKKVFLFLQEEQKILGVSVWLQNIFVPMYGQYDLAGRAISFFVRLFQIIVRSIVLFIWALISLASVIVWLALPFLLLFTIVYQLS